jgi:hypothetical protein
MKWFGFKVVWLWRNDGDGDRNVSLHSMQKKSPWPSSKDWLMGI